MNVFVFDIETVPDVTAGKQLLGLHDCADADIAQAMFSQRKQETGHEFLPHYLQKIITISVVLKTRDKIAVWSLGESDASEAELITRFFDGLNRYQPTLVTWNGSGFDLPVIHYRALLHKISAPLYWETEEPGFKWNNYINRYHYRHLDVMDVLASYQAKANAPLDKLAVLLGFPGKMGMSGNKVWDYYLQGDIHSIRNYCETDVLNTYLVYLRFELFRGKISLQQYEDECLFIKAYLQQQNKAHFNEFLSIWESNEKK